jgi:5-methylthioadenosine/S-adenosylhomocysteine deaminase
LQFDFTVHGLTPTYRPEDVYVGDRLGIADAFNAGVTTTNGWWHVACGQSLSEEPIRALKESGARAISPVPHRSAAALPTGQSKAFFCIP